MRKTNHETFEELPEQDFFKSNVAAAPYFRDLALFPGVLGMDERTSGFVAIHRGHSPGGMADELPVCAILKGLGFGVVLLDERAQGPVPDALIGGRVFEIKRLRKAKNLNGAVQGHFRKGARQASNLLLHIEQSVNLDSLRTAIMISAQLCPEIKSVWIVFRSKLWQIDRKVILKGLFQFQ